jgi:hypothetical protein
MIVSMAATVIMIVVVLIAAVIAFVIVVPFMTVFNAPMSTVPITVVEAFSVVARADPTRTFIGWPAPITFMPAVMS